MDKRYNKVISLPGAIATRPKVLTDETYPPSLTHDHGTVGNLRVAGAASDGYTPRDDD